MRPLCLLSGPPSTQCQIQSNPQVWRRWTLRRKSSRSTRYALTACSARWRSGVHRAARVRCRAASAVQRQLGSRHDERDWMSSIHATMNSTLLVQKIRSTRTRGAINCSARLLRATFHARSSRRATSAHPTSPSPLLPPPKPPPPPPLPPPQPPPPPPPPPLQLASAWLRGHPTLALRRATCLRRRFRCSALPVAATGCLWTRAAAACRSSGCSLNKLETCSRLTCSTIFPKTWHDEAAAT
mmetsp:Transcript_9602/g.21053  ORF Transcript_9602/g.21053 Transcript_9602/m.21053 type:complete len:241 (-) Transcript_9602:1219-1941(-)